MQNVEWRRLYRLCTLQPPPQFVKAASPQDALGNDELPDTAYADRLRRQYPTHTAAATWTSVGLFLEKLAYDQDSWNTHTQLVWQRLIKAANYFGIVPFVRQLLTGVRQQFQDDPSRLPDHDFGVVTVENGQKVRRYPLRNALEVKNAAAYLVENRDHFLRAQRRIFADRILEKAAQYGADITEQLPVLQRLAGNGICTDQEAIKLVRERLRMVPVRANDPVYQEMVKLATLMENNGQRYNHWPLLDSLADVIDNFDHLYGLKSQYKQGLARPEDVLFRTTSADVEELATQLVENPYTGSFYRATDLSNLPPQRLRDVFGDKFVRQVIQGDQIDLPKLQRLLKKLPPQQAELFDAFLREEGIPPIKVVRRRRVVKFNIPAQVAGFKG